MSISLTFHWGALVPLAMLLMWWRDAEARYWAVALGFSVSWFADVATIALGGSWVVTHLSPPLQFGLFAWAFGAPWAMVVLALIASAQVVGTELAGPDVYGTLAGSVIVLAVSAGKQLGWSMLAYCGAATALYMVLITEMWRPAFMPLWYAYQTARLVAFGLFGRALWRTATA